MTTQEWIDILTPVVGPVLTALAKKLAPKIPKPLVPLIAVILGAAANLVAGNVIDGADPNALNAVLLGLAGVGVREATKKVNPLTASTTATPLIFLFGLLALPAYAAEEKPVSYYRSGEFSIDAFAGLNTPDFDQERSYAGFGVNLFLTENIGVGASTALEDLNGSTLDNFSLRGIYRIPINQNAIYGFAGGQRILNRGDWAGELGVGVERRWTPNFGTFLEVGMHKELTGERDATATGRVGVRVAF